MTRLIELVCASCLGAMLALGFVAATTAPGEGGTASDQNGFYWKNFLSLGRNGMASNAHLMSSPLDLSNVDVMVRSITVTNVCKAGRIQLYPPRTDAERVQIKSDPANDGSMYTVSRADGSTGLIYVEDGTEYAWETTVGGDMSSGFAALLRDATGQVEERELNRAGS